MRIPTATIRRYWPRLRLALRWIWFVLVAVFVVAYVRRNAGLISSTIREFNALVLAATAAVTVAGKVTVSVQCGTITAHLGHRFSRRQTFWMYSASDVVKYVPGGVWNAVARVKLYAVAGMRHGHAARAFALEKYWQVLGALATGAIALTPMLHKELTGASPVSVVTAGEVVLIAVVWTVLTFVGAHRITGHQPKIGFAVRSMVEQCIMALTFGAGLAIPMAVVNADVTWMTAVGAFSIGRGVGYVAVFAPAGIGVREVITLWALGRGVDADLALVALGVNRVMTFVADVASFVAGVVVRRSDTAPATMNAE